MNLIRQIEENFFAVGRYWGSLNSSFLQYGSIGAMHTGTAISDINWIWNEKPLTAADAKAIADIKETYKKINLRFWWWVYPDGQSPETSRLLQDAGLRLLGQVPCMAADLNDPATEEKIPGQIKIAQVQDKKDLSVWEDVSFHGFEMPERARERYRAFVASFNIGPQSPQKLFLAYCDGIPVASSLLFTQKNSAGIYYVSTLPSYRNKGCGLKITQAAMQAAKEAGFQNVILQATPQGAKVYIRAGFKEYCHAEINEL